MKKEEIEKKKSLARALYLSGMEQKETAEKVGVSAVTVSNGAPRGNGRRQGRRRTSPAPNW